MNIRNTVRCLLRPGVFAAVFLGFTMLVQPAVVSANVSFIHDNFNSLYLKPDSRAKWWIINWYGQDNQQQRAEDFCGLGSCINAMNQHGQKFVRLSTFPGSQSGFFVNADLSELHTGFPSEGSGTWTPSYGHPVILEARVRWSGQYNQDGTGAVGSSGIWLWNSPYNLENYDPGATSTALGFNWAEYATVGGLLGGLKVLALDSNNPVYINKPTRTVNMQNWVFFSLIWSQDANGVQKVRYFINGEDLGTAVLPRPLSNLSLETWNDNELGQINPDGTISITYNDIPSQQDFDVNEINLLKL